MALLWAKDFGSLFMGSRLYGGLIKCNFSIYFALDLERTSINVAKGRGIASFEA